MNERHEATFGERVRRVRLRRGWTQEQLADETESFTQVGISNIETGKRPEYVSDLLTLAYALRVHPVDLLNGLPPELIRGPHPAFGTCPHYNTQVINRNEGTTP